MSQGTYRTRIVPVACTPLEALRLAEDISALRRARKELESVDAYNTSDDPDKDVLWLMIQKLRMFERYAEGKLRRNFLVKNLNERPTRKSKHT